MPCPYIPPAGCEFKTIEQACAILQIGRSTLRKMIKDDAIAHVKLNGAYRIIFKTDEPYAEIVKREFVNG